MISKYILDTLDKMNILINGERIFEVPSHILTDYDISYGKHRLETYDFFQNTAENKGLIINIHGGGFVSGGKNGIRHFCCELCKFGYDVLSIDYPLPRERLHPEPIRSVFKAYAELVNKYPEISEKSVYLTGDSAGAYMAAFTAATVTNAELAASQGVVPNFSQSKLKGLLLYCGLYDIRLAYKSFPKFIFRDMLKEYLGKKRRDLGEKELYELSPIEYCGSFPPTLLVSSGGDWLCRQTKNLEMSLAEKDVFYKTFYGNRKDMHDFQFNLKTDSAQKALEATKDFLNAITKL